MSNPDIDRRCAECGASVRSGAMFCPQCGVGVDKDEKKVKPIVEAVPTKTAEGNLAIEQSREVVPDLSETQPLISASAPADLSRTQPLKSPSAAKGLEKNVQGKVQRIKKASSVVLDQAAYDPSLRFVLVAAVLFILCLFLVLLSRVLG